MFKTILVIMNNNKVIESIRKIVNTTVKRNGFDWLFEKVGVFV